MEKCRKWHRAVKFPGAIRLVKIHGRKELPGRLWDCEDREGMKIEAT